MHSELRTSELFLVHQVFVFLWEFYGNKNLASIYIPEKNLKSVNMDIWKLKDTIIIKYSY